MITPFYKEMKRALERGMPFAVATVVRIYASTPREPGAKMGVFSDGSSFGTIGGGKLEKLVIDDARGVIKGGTPLLKRYKLLPEEKGGIGSECGGDVEIFIEPASSGEKLLLVGAGHVARSIAKIAGVLGTAVEVVDDRTEFANRERFPGVVIHNASVSEADWKNLITDETRVIIVSRDHAMDRDALAAVLEHECAYVGLIGSKRKIAFIMDSLKKQGVEKKRMESVHTPIGIDIGAETPEEIALAVLAEIVSLKRRGESPLSLKETSRGE